MWEEKIEYSTLFHWEENNEKVLKRNSTATIMINTIKIYLPTLNTIY